MSLQLSVQSVEVDNELVDISVRVLLEGLFPLLNSLGERRMEFSNLLVSEFLSLDELLLSSRADLLLFVLLESLGESVREFESSLGLLDLVLSLVVDFHFRYLGAF